MKSSKRHAQVAIEFVILIGLLMFIMLLFLTFIHNYVVDVRSDKDRELLKDIAYAIQAEIHIAASVDDGYERNFIVPDLLDSMNYTINLTGNQIWATTTKAEIVLNIPNVIGNLTKGGNTIRKSDGIIYLNVGIANDTSGPIVTLINPPDESTDVDGNIIFTYQTSDLDSGVTNCSLIFDGNLNQTDNSIVEGLNQYFYMDNLSEASYNWTVNCTDNSPQNNTGQASEWSFDVELAFNDPPTTPDSIICDGATCDATFSDIINMTCSGSTDPEGDNITYHIDALYAEGNYTFQTVQAESGSFGYSGGYGSSSSCICNSPSGNCIRDTTWNPGTWASATYTSAFTSTRNRVFIYYCSENDGDDSYEIYSDGVQKDAWTTSYEDNSWELALLDDVDLKTSDDFEINCSRGTSSSYCRVDYVIFDDRSWSNIGNHSENASLLWNVSSFQDQEWVDLRCRAIDEAGSGIYSNYHDPLTDMELDTGGGGGQSGSTTNPDFDAGSTGWTGSDWDRGAWEVNPSEGHSSSGGNPDGRVYVYIPSGRNDEIGGYWRQGFDVTVNNPSSVTCGFDWRVVSYDATPNTYQVYVFVDSSSGEPTIGQEVWSSEEITSTTSWASESFDCTSAVASADTYYYKFAVWVETNGWPNDGPYQVNFDNAQASWQE